MCTEREGLNATAIKAPFPLLTPNTSAPRGCLSSPPAAPNSPTAQPLGVNPPSWAEARTVRGQVRLERAKWGWRGGGGGCAHPRASPRVPALRARGGRWQQIFASTGRSPARPRPPSPSPRPRRRLLPFFQERESFAKGWAPGPPSCLPAAGGGGGNKVPFVCGAARGLCPPSSGTGCGGGEVNELP